MGTATLIARHKVKDYGAWRAVCDSVEDLCQQHGCTAGEVMADVGSTEPGEATDRAGAAGPARIAITVEA